MSNNSESPTLTILLGICEDAVCLAEDVSVGPPIVDSTLLILTISLSIVALEGFVLACELGACLCPSMFQWYTRTRDRILNCLRCIRRMAVGSDSDGSESDSSENDGSESDGSESDGSESDGSESDGSESDGSDSDDSGTSSPTNSGSETLEARRPSIIVSIRRMNGLRFPQPNFTNSGLRGSWNESEEDRLRQNRIRDSSPGTISVSATTSRAHERNFRPPANSPLPNCVTARRALYATSQDVGATSRSFDATSQGYSSPSQDSSSPSRDDDLTSIDDDESP